MGYITNIISFIRKWIFVAFLFKVITYWLLRIVEITSIALHIACKPYISLIIHCDTTVTVNVLQMVETGLTGTDISKSWVLLWSTFDWTQREWNCHSQTWNIPVNSHLFHILHVFKRVQHKTQLCLVHIDKSGLEFYVCLESASFPETDILTYF